jgi:hypothetical protein
MDNVKKAVSATNPAVRNAAMNLIGTLYLYLGSQLSEFFEDEKSQVQQQIQAEFDKVNRIDFIWIKAKIGALLFIIVSSVDVVWPDFKVTCMYVCMYVKLTYLTNSEILVILKVLSNSLVMG